MSKTKGTRKRYPSYLIYMTIVTVLVIYLKGRIPLKLEWYIEGFIMATASYLLWVIAIKLVRRHSLAGASMKKIDGMDGVEFEQYLGILYKRHGYKVEFTPGTMDFGADLILTKNGVKTIVQAKRYRNLVGEAAVQQALAAVGYYKADQCLVVTNSHFTPAAKELASKTGVILIDRTKLGKSVMYR